jgi:RNA-splicing ligase RtcB
MVKDPRLVRLDATRLKVHNDQGVDATLFANEQVPVESGAVDELVQMRRDIVEKKLEDIKKEAPFAYKGIGPIVNTLTEANIAQPVAELTPLMTVKG